MAIARHEIHAAMRLSPRCAGCAYPRVRSPFITSIFLSQALQLGNKDDNYDNKDKNMDMDKREQFDSMSHNTSDGTDDSGGDIRYDKR
jgi:hypothetical protein